MFFADPALIDDIDATAATLQKTLNVPAAEIATVLTARNALNGPAYIPRLESSAASPSPPRSRRCSRTRW